MFEVDYQTKEICNDAFIKFVGTGLYIGLFFMSILYIIYNMKRSDNKENKIKIVFGFFSIIILVLNLNPIFTIFLTKALNETSTYWRVYWLLPIGISISFMFTDLIFKKEKISERIFLIILIIGCIFLSGNYMYNSDDIEKFMKVNNYYKVPDNVLEIISIVSNDNEEYKKLAGSEEFLVYTRQYDGTILLPESRITDGEYSEYSIVTLLKNSKIDNILMYCIQNSCNYLVINRDIEEISNEYLNKNNMIKLYINDEYILYKFNDIFSLR